MATITEVRKSIEEKRAALSSIYGEASKEGRELDFDKITTISGTSAEKAKQLRERNDEITALVKELEAMEVAEDGRAEFEKNEKARVVRVPGENSDDDGGSTSAKGRASLRQQKSLTDFFIDSDAFKKFGGKSSPLSTVELGGDLGWVWAKSMSGRKALFDEQTGYVPEITRSGTLLPFPQRTPVIADLIPQGRTTQIGIKYMEETVNTNAVASVAEGAQKPESAIAFEERTSLVRKLATVLPVTDEMFADEPQMRSYLEARLGIFLELAEEMQILSGSGMGTNLEGILTNPNIQTRAQATVAGDSVPDVIYRAMTDVRVNALLTADGIVMNPLNWQDVRLLRTTDGIYIWGSPADAGPERMWGLNIVQSTAIPENTALVGAFRTSAQIFRRSDVQFSVSDQHADFFIFNKLMLRIEERLALVIYRPKGFVEVTLTAPI